MAKRELKKRIIYARVCESIGEWVDEASTKENMTISAFVEQLIITEKKRQEAQMPLEEDTL